MNGKPIAYLDSGASSQRVLASIQSVDRYERRHHSNVHRGSHTLSAEATAAYEGARATVADHIGAGERREVIFVRNATEAINLVARAWGDVNVGEGDVIVLSEMEHHSNLVPWQQLAERRGASLEWIGLTEDGLLDLDSYSAALERAPKLVAIAHVSNVLGTENDLAEISRLAHDAGALVLADGAQAAPKMALDMAALGVDFYAFTGHKAYAPTGIGALWARGELLAEMPPFLGGGSMIRKVTKEKTTWADPPARFEAGTPAIAQAIGLASALRWLDSIGMDSVTAHEREITARARRPRRSPRPARDRPALLLGPGRPGLLRPRGDPPARRQRDPRPPRRRGPRRPPLHQDPDERPRRCRDHPRELRRLPRPPRRSTAWSRASTTPGGSSSSELAFSNTFAADQGRLDRPLPPRRFQTSSSKMQQQGSMRTVPMTESSVVDVMMPTRTSPRPDRLDPALREGLLHLLGKLLQAVAPAAPSAGPRRPPRSSAQYDEDAAPGPVAARVERIST